MIERRKWIKRGEKEVDGQGWWAVVAVREEAGGEGGRGWWWRVRDGGEGGEGSGGEGGGDRWWGDVEVREAVGWWW